MLSNKRPDPSKPAPTQAALAVWCAMLDGQAVPKGPYRIECDPVLPITAGGSVRLVPK